jgi:hypothetical protein
MTTSLDLNDLLANEELSRNARAQVSAAMAALPSHAVRRITNASLWLSMPWMDSRRL